MLESHEQEYLLLNSKRPFIHLVFFSYILFEAGLTIQWSFQNLVEPNHLVLIYDILEISSCIGKQTMIPNDVSCLTSYFRAVFRPLGNSKEKRIINTELCNWKRVANFCYVNKFFKVL